MAFKEVEEFLEPNNPLMVPELLKRWHNFADPSAPVTLAKRLAADLQPIKPPSSKQVGQCAPFAQAPEVMAIRRSETMMSIEEAGDRSPTDRVFP